MPPTIWLCKDKKDIRENVPIALNNVLNLYWQRCSNMKHKVNLVSLQVQTSHFGIGANPKQAGISFRKKTAQKLDHIKNNPFAAIVALLTIYREVPPSIIDVGPITTRELLKTIFNPNYD